MERIKCSFAAFYSIPSFLAAGGCSELLLLAKPCHIISVTVTQSLRLFLCSFSASVSSARRRFVLFKCLSWPARSAPGRTLNDPSKSRAAAEWPAGSLPLVTISAREESQVKFNRFFYRPRTRMTQPTVEKTKSTQQRPRFRRLIHIRRCYKSVVVQWLPEEEFSRVFLLFSPIVTVRGRSWRA